MTTPLTLEEVRALEISPAVCRLLSPEDVARIGVLPILESAGGEILTVAADPTAGVNIERVLRMLLGVRKVEVRPASREAMEALIESQFQSYWMGKGWSFPGFPVPQAPGPVGPEPQSRQKSKHQPKPAPKPESRREPKPEPWPLMEPRQKAQDPLPVVEPPSLKVGDHPAVLFMESDEKSRQFLGELFMGSGYEPRFAASRDDLEREVLRSPPAVVVTRRDGPVPPESIFVTLRKTDGSVALRVLRGYAQAILEDQGDDRLPAFLFDLVRFFTGLMATAGGIPVHRTEARAQAAERAARRMGLKPGEVEAARLAVFFGDLESHLGRLGGAAGGGGGETRKASASVDPIRQLLDPERTPYPIAAALEARRERHDGSGPKGLAGNAIAPPARILAAVDSFFALKDGGVCGEELEARLRAEAGKGLDPRAVESVLRAERAERLVDNLGSDRDRIVVIDPDAVASSILQMRLANAGCEVEVHRDGEKALAAIQARAPDLVISEIAMPGLDGFTLLLRLRKAEPTREIPFVFVTERTDRGSSVRGFELGADDYIAKPADLELLVAKAKGMVRKAKARRPVRQSEKGGVSGSLREMGIVDLLQVLASSRRTVRIRVEDGKGGVGELAMDKGQLVDARLGDESGQEALFGLFTWHEGRFTVQTAEPPAARTINAPIEMLLLEACRLQDEAGQPA